LDDAGGGGEGRKEKAGSLPMGKKGFLSGHFPSGKKKGPSAIWVDMSGTKREGEKKLGEEKRREAERHRDLSVVVLSSWEARKN